MQGDSTAKLFGRLTLNPIVHFDPLGGTLTACRCCSARFLFGWAKPTPVNPSNLRDRRNGEVHRRARRAVLEPRHGDPRRVRRPACSSRPACVDAAGGRRRRRSYYFVVFNVAARDLQPDPGPAARRLGAAVPVPPPPQAWQIRPFLVPVRDLRPARRRSCWPAGSSPASSSMSRTSWWASKARQLGRHLAARVSDEERGRAGRLAPPAELALFDAQHVADRRHGLDVVARPAARRRARPRRARRRGCSTTARRATPAPRPRIAWSLGEAFGPWVLVDRRGACPGWGAALTRLRDHAEASARARRVGRACRRSPWTSSATRPSRRTRGRARVPGRGRGLLMADDARGTPPSVAFGEGRRPEAATHVTLPAFDGPLALLLALIEARQLDVLTVPLGALADAYLDALATLDDDRMGNVSAFVAIASQLILIKSRAMLPRRRPDGRRRARRRGPGSRGRAPGPADPVPRVPRRRARGCSTRRRRGSGLFHREPTAARAAGVAGARPPAADAALDPALLVDALDGAGPGRRRRRRRRPRRSAAPSR